MADQDEPDQAEGAEHEVHDQGRRGGIGKKQIGEHPKPARIDQREGPENPWRRPLQREEGEQRDQARHGPVPSHGRGQEQPSVALVNS